MNRVLWILLVGATIVVAQRRAPRSYSSKYDNIDLKAILANDQRRNEYYNCYLDKAPCLTDEAKFFKSILPDVFVTQCRKCSEKQKELFLILTEWYTMHRPEEWLVLVAKIIETARKNNASG